MALFLGTIVAGLILFEVGLRLAGISFPAFYAYDDVRGIKLAPGKEGRYQQEGSGHVSVNSRGYRDVEHAVGKPPGVFRIAVIGDSFAEARQVDIEETFWKRLETVLPSCPELNGRQVEVLNFGINGYNTVQELLTLRLDALDFDPDLVLLAFTTANDVSGNSERLSKNDDRPYVRLRDGELVLDSSFREMDFDHLYRRFLMEAVHHSRVFELLLRARHVYSAYMANRERQRLDRMAEVELGLRGEAYVDPAGDEAWTEAWATTEALLASMAREVSDAGAAFVLMSIPTSVQVHPDPALRQRFMAKLGISDLLYPERRIIALGERVGFPVITLDERMQEVAVRKGVYFHGFENTVMGQGHWNEEGHRIVAELLAEDLCARNLLF